MTVARELEKDDWRAELARNGRKCEAICPQCKRSCMGHSGHLYSADTADVTAHQCSRHWWLAVRTANGEIISVSGNVVNR